jgi:hypothetical protein
MLLAASAFDRKPTEFGGDPHQFTAPPDSSEPGYV